MGRWIKAFRESTGETKTFIFMSASFMILIVVTTIYCYARLDYVRSYQATQPTQAQPIQR